MLYLRDCMNTKDETLLSVTRLIAFFDYAAAIFREGEDIGLLITLAL